MLKNAILALLILFASVSPSLAQEMPQGPVPTQSAYDLDNAPGPDAPADDRVGWCQAFTALHYSAPLESESAVTLGENGEGPSVRMVGDGNDMQSCLVEPSVYRKIVLEEEAARDR